MQSQHGNKHKINKKKGREGLAWVGNKVYKACNGVGRQGHA